MSKRAVSGIMLILFLTGVLSLAFNIQLAKAESETARIDNLIVTTSDLEAAATRLAQWKNSCGIPSKVLNTTWIYSHYSGVDEPEKIRNCIKDFHSNFLTRYVTIFGDVDKVPIRYAYVPYAEEKLVATDLYYADLNYTWDDNFDGLYADLGNDTVDGIPDVFVGRIPVSLTDVADGVVTKIIEYQQQLDVSADWVNRVVLAAGWFDDDSLGWTVPNCENVSKILVGKDIVRLYESAGNLTNSNIDYEVGRGCSFLHFAGHSVAPDPLLGIPKEYPWLLYKDFWGTHWLGWREVYGWTNGPKLPVVMSSACSSAKISVEECIGEYFICNPNGGAIAYLGPTGISPWNPYALTGELMLRIYEAFMDGHTRLGEMWGVAISNYIQNNGLSGVNGELNERTIIEYILLGDPTLRIYNGPETLKVPEEYATIQGAINSAYSGDVIEVANGNYHEHVVINKTVSLIGESKYGTVILGDGTGTVVYVLANNVNITGFAIVNGSIGIETDWRYHQKVNIVGNIIDHNTIGVQLYEVYNSLFTDNQVSNNNNCGILLINNFPNFSNNTIINNVMWHNGYGIWMDNSDGNTIYHNNFINNKQQVRIDWGNNTFDNGYPSGGNYWSDYTGTDVKCGPSQDFPSSDFIGDTPYIIDINNRDRYPLMYPYGSSPPPTYNLTIIATVGGTTNPPAGTYSYAANQTVQVTAIPDTGYLFGYWELNGINVGSANPYSILMDKDYVLKAIFTVIPPPLSASLSPLSVSLLVGQSVMFSSIVSGGYPPYGYQWYLNGSLVSEATSSIWNFTPLTAGTYKVYLKVTDNSGNVAISDTATITVAPQLAVSISPMSVSILVGQQVTFTSTTSGGYPPYTYQWYLNGNPVSEATSCSLIFTPTTSGIYYIHLKVTDAKGNTAQSDSARIMVSTVPVGGYSIPIQQPTSAKPLTLHIALLTILTAIFITIKQKTRRKRRQ